MYVEIKMKMLGLNIQQKHHSHVRMVKMKWDVDSKLQKDVQVRKKCERFLLIVTMGR